MKNNIKSFICGMLVMGVISSAAAIAADVWQTINVLPNTIKVVVDGKEIQADNFLYNDTTYLPIRAVSEALGKDVQYDTETGTATISEKKEDDAVETVSKYTPQVDEKTLWNYFDNQNGIWYVAASYIVDYYDGVTVEYDEWNADNTIDVLLYKDGVKITELHCVEIGSRAAIPYDTFVEEIEPLLK